MLFHFGVDIHVDSVDYGLHSSLIFSVWYISVHVNSVSFLFFYFLFFFFGLIKVQLKTNASESEIETHWNCIFRMSHLIERSISTVYIVRYSVNPDYHFYTLRIVYLLISSLENSKEKNSGSLFKCYNWS